MTSSPADSPQFTASVDIGGTFTDVLIQQGDRVVSSFKILTTAGNPEVGVLTALGRWTEGRIAELVHATTLGSNALLSPERTHDRTVALVTTRGVGDVIEIGRQNRSELYNLEFTRPRPLVASARRYELETRSLENGAIAARVPKRAATALKARMKRDGVRSIAISFLHSYAHPENERFAARVLRGSVPHVSLSSEIAPEPREFERTSTTIVNAVLMPVISEYIGRLERGLDARSHTNLSVMASSGGLISTEEARSKPVQIIESGPAAGVIAAAALARRIGIRNVISFDMGGTTAKAGTVSDGSVETSTELEVGGTSHHGRRTRGSGYPVRFPFVDLVEVSAGGGTIISSDLDGALSVGPASAGSEPGPACYGRGGTKPTLTDANLALGVLGTQLLGGELLLDEDAAVRALRSLGEPYSVAEDALRLADLEMSRALRLVTVERGLDPSQFSLIAFGGAGPQHAANLAQELHIREVIIPPRPGLFSALGLLQSDWRFERRMAFPRDPASGFARLESDLRRKHPRSSFLRSADCRYAGQGSELTVRVGSPRRAAIVREFKRVHGTTFGFELDREVEIVMIRLFAVVPRVKPSPGGGGYTPLETGSRLGRFGGRRSRIRTYNRDGLTTETPVRGPACVEDYDSAIFVPRGWKGIVGPYRELRLTAESE